MTPPLRPVPGETLGEAGQVYVTQAAARAYAAAAGTLPEEARRTLTELLLDARPLPEPTATGATQWRHRSRTSWLDVTAHVVREGRLLIVVHVHVRGVRPRGPRKHVPRGDPWHDDRAPYPLPQWDINDEGTIVGECESCGRTLPLQEVVDPFEAEGIIPPEDAEGPQFWCRPCFDQRRDDV